MAQVKLLTTLSASIVVIIFFYWDFIDFDNFTKYQPFSADSEDNRIDVKFVSKKSLNRNATKIRIQKIFGDRTERIRKVCEAENSKIPAKLGKINQIIWSINAKHNLLMCRTAKHGSTTWSYNFVQIYTHG